MDRRQFLASATAASALPLAGCSAAGLRTTDLRPVEEETDEDATHLRFEFDGERLLTFSTRYLAGYDESAGQIPLEFDAWHTRDTRVEGFRIAVRAPADAREPKTTVALETPPYGPGPSIEFYRDYDRRETVVAVDDLGENGDATLTLGLLLEPREMPETLPVRVACEFDLSENGPLGRSYHLTGETTVEIARERDQ